MPRRACPREEGDERAVLEYLKRCCLDVGADFLFHMPQGKTRKKGGWKWQRNLYLLNIRRIFFLMARPASLIEAFSQRLGNHLVERTGCLAVLAMNKALD